MDLQENDLNELLGYTETLRADLVATDDATFVKTLVGREYSQSTLTSLVGDTRATADILVGQELSDASIGLFYTYSQENQGKVVGDIQPAQVKSLLGHNLADSQTASILSNTASTRDAMIEEPTGRLVAILAYNLTNAEADVLYKYSAELRQSFVDANDQALVKSLLGLDQSEAQAAAILASFVEKGEIVDQVDTEDKDPNTGDGETGDDVVSDAIITLLADSQANGNDHIVPILYEEGNGKIDYTLLATGQLGNDLLTDVTVDSHLNSTRFFNVQDAVMNLFYEEVALIFNTWVLPNTMTPQQVWPMPAKSLEAATWPSCRELSTWTTTLTRGRPSFSSPPPTKFPSPGKCTLPPHRKLPPKISLVAYRRRGTLQLCRRLQTHFLRRPA